ncbi:MAG: GNAT family N-acetyltransferase [Bacteroidetes bacterium HGW-Bacteroidetes-17]|nr:MAG: GNAT family N-acetyltransferase [Bacteroidetes bacterium HGW-Bacteroidetes-17]
MSIQRLYNIFKPKRIAIVGISSDPRSVGGTTLSNLVSGGFGGVVYPVNPKYEAVMGIPCYPNVKSLPKIPDIAVITTGSKMVAQLVEECGEAGINGIIIMTAGFEEIGEKGKLLQDEIRTIVSKYPEMRVIGPNCMGIIVPGLNMNLSFARNMPKKGHVAFISQSGALGAALLDWAHTENIGFSYFVSIGNAMDLSFGELIDFFGQDANTKTIVLYVESIKNVRKFMTAARAFARKKPIIVYKAGRYPESAQAAFSHTGAAAAEDAVYDAVFRRAGMARVYNIGNIFNFTDLVGRKHIPKGANLAIVTNAGGPGVMATDNLISKRGSLAQLSDETIQKLNVLLPPFWTHGNPVDVIGDADATRFSQATHIVLDDPNVDAVLVILTPQGMTQPTETAEQIVKIAEQHSKPIMAAWMGGKSIKEGIAIFNKAGIATFESPEHAIEAFMTMVRYSRNLSALFETPKDIPVHFTYDRKKLREEFNLQMLSKGNILTESDSKNFLETYGIKTASPLIALNEREAILNAEKIGYPIAMKVLSVDIEHKEKAGGVILNIGSEKDVKISFRTIMRNIADYNPEAIIEGVTVQAMQNSKGGIEMILGLKKDQVFGTVIKVGMGGVGSELYKDISLGFPPLNERLARLHLENLIIYPLLKGYKGSKPKDIDKLIETMIRLSYIGADYPEIEELTINPLLVSENDVIALDARVVIDKNLIDKTIPKYSHLVLHPYPEKYVSSHKLKDGTQIILRPIKPEDEPLWLELLDGCSKEAIYSRFRYNFHYDSHEIATQFCFIDYAREIAIVVEIMHEGKRQLIGVGRLIADPDHESAEYAILITDKWQRKELGVMLTEYCLEIAKNWGLKQFLAQTTKDNQAMISVFRKMKFKIKFNADSTVDVSRDLI